MAIVNFLVTNQPKLAYLSPTAITRSLRKRIHELKKEIRSFIQGKRDEKKAMVSGMKEIYNPIITEPIEKARDEIKDEIEESRRRYLEGRDKIILKLEDERDFLKSIEEKDHDEPILFNVERILTEGDREVFEMYGLPLPSLAIRMNNEDLLIKKEESIKLARELGRQISLLKRSKKNVFDKEKSIKEAMDDIVSMRKFRFIVDDIIKARGRYGAAFSEQVGGLIFDMPKLHNEMILDVYKDGNKIYQNNADTSLIDLLTKRYNKKMYSKKAIQIYKRIYNCTFWLITMVTMVVMEITMVMSQHVSAWRNHMSQNAPWI